MYTYDFNAYPLFLKYKYEILSKYVSAYIEDTIWMQGYPMPNPYMFLVLLYSITNMPIIWCAFALLVERNSKEANSKRISKNAAVNILHAQGSITCIY